MNLTRVAFHPFLGGLRCRRGHSSGLLLSGGQLAHGLYDGLDVVVLRCVDAAVLRVGIVVLLVGGQLKAHMRRSVLGCHGCVTQGNTRGE